MSYWSAEPQAAAVPVAGAMLSMIGEAGFAGVTLIGLRCGVRAGNLFTGTARKSFLKV